MTKKKTAAEKLRKKIPKIKLGKDNVSKGSQSPTPTAPPRRNDWAANHAIIRDKFIELIHQNKRRPTIAEIATASGLSVACIKKHISGLTFEPTKHDLRILTDDVLITVYQSARDGNSGAQRLWFELMEGWKPGLMLTDPNGRPLQGNQVIIYLADNGRDKRNTATGGPAG